MTRTLYERIKVFVKSQDFVTHTILQTKFNINYKYSKELVAELQGEGLLTDSDQQGRFYVKWNKEQESWMIQKY